MPVTHQQLFSEAQKQQAMADMLQGRALQQRGPQQTGAVAPTMHWGEGLAQLGEAWLARRAGKKADEKFNISNEARRKQVADAIAGFGGSRTHDGLPAVQNSDGSHSTELSITVTDPRLNGGQPTNIPSLWGGSVLPEGEAVSRALQSGRQYQSFGSIEEAVTAAKARSNAGGAGSGSSVYQRAQAAIEAGVDPAVIGQWMQSQQPQNPIKLGQGDTLIDPNTMQPLAQGQGKPPKLVPVVGPDGPTLVPESEAAGMTPYRTGGVTVDARNMGSIPAGWEMVEEGGTRRLQPIKDGPADIKAREAAEADAARQSGKTEQADIVSQEIDRALSAMETGVLPDTGYGALLSGVPLTDAHAISNNLKTIKANIGFDKLQAMREASPTGGALGQVSEKEIDFLQSVAGSLAQTQRPEDLQYNLNRLWNAYQDVIHGPGQGPERRPLDKAAPTQQGDPLGGLSPELRAKYGLE